MLDDERVIRGCHFRQILPRTLNFSEFWDKRTFGILEGFQKLFGNDMEAAAVSLCAVV